MGNSTLVNYTKKSPNHSGKRTHSIDRISPHCVVGQCSVETLGNIFLPSSRQASCNYAIGADGRVALIVDEENRSWCTSSNANDQRAVTIECASDVTAPYAFKDVVYNKLIDLCVDICKRNGKKKLLWISDKTKALAYEPKSDEMLLTVHRWFANKSCPGDWMYARMGDLADKVTAKLGGTSTQTTATGELYRVRKSWADAKTQIGAYADINNAKKESDKHSGYSVFDSKGNKVYPTTTSSNTIPQTASDKAQSFDKSIAGTYIVNTGVGALNLRNGAGTVNTSVIRSVPKGKTVQNYGYYSTVNGVRWLYVEYNGAVGFMTSEYLKKK